MRTWSSVSPIKKAILVGILTIVIYLTVVIVTTPALDPLDAISAAFQLNSIVIIGMGIGIGMQIFLTEKSKMISLGCILSSSLSTGNKRGSKSISSLYSSMA